MPGTNIAYWGPQIKVGVPQRALNINMDAHTNVESLSFTFNNNMNAIPTVFYYEELSKAVIADSDSADHAAQSAARLDPADSRSGLQPVSDDLSKRPLPQSIMIGLAKAAQWAEAVTARGELDVLRYGSVLKARQLVGVRGAGTAYDGLYYVKSVTHKIKARRVQAELRAQPQRLDLDPAAGGGMSDEKTTRYYGKYRGTVVNNIDPEQRGRIQAIVPDVQGLMPIDLGDAVRADCRQARRRLHGAANRRRRVDRIRAGRSGISDLGRRFLGRVRRSAAGGLGAAADPAGANHRDSNDAAKLDRDQRRDADADAGRRCRRRRRRAPAASFCAVPPAR